MLLQVHFWNEVSRLAFQLFCFGIPITECLNCRNSFKNEKLFRIMLLKIENKTAERYSTWNEDILIDDGLICLYYRFTFCKLLCQKKEEIKRYGQQFLFRIITVVTLRDFYGKLKFIVIGEFLKGVKRTSAFLYVNRI